MLTTCTKLASFPGPFQHPVAKDFLFVCGESLQQGYTKLATCGSLNCVDPSV